MKIYIKNMVCDRCTMVVRQEFQKAEIPIDAIQLGLVETKSDLSADEMHSLQQSLHTLGFEIIDDRKSRVI